MPTTATPMETTMPKPIVAARGTLAVSGSRLAAVRARPTPDPTRPPNHRYGARTPSGARSLPGPTGATTKMTRSTATMSRSVLGSAATMRNGSASTVPSRRGNRPRPIARSSRSRMRPASSLTPARIPNGIPTATSTVPRLAAMSPIGPSPSARPTPLSAVATMKATVNPTTNPSSAPPTSANSVRTAPGWPPPWGRDTRRCSTRSGVVAQVPRRPCILPVRSARRHEPLVTGPGSWVLCAGVHPVPPP